MPFVYNYANDTPPAPFVLLNLSNPGGPAAVSNFPARVDTGADRTVIPTELVSRLGLGEVARLVCVGLGGQRVELPVYEVQMVVRDLDPIVLEVAASDGETHVLLGRDVLNRYKIVLDGPNAKLEIG